MRKLYLTKRCHLAMQRDALIHELRYSQPKKLDPGATLSSVSKLATKLRQNAAEDYLTYCKVACAGRRGVSAPLQSHALCHPICHHFIDRDGSHAKCCQRCP